MKVLVTCPPMIGMIDRLGYLFEGAGVDYFCPEFQQTMSEEELVEIVPKFDGWIIGDDPATTRVFEAGKAGRLRAAVKWGIGIDNVDMDAARGLGLPITNTPMMFGREVADLAMAYVTALARDILCIHRGVEAGGWPKPRGISLAGRAMGLVGFGDIGRNVARRALAADMNVIAYDPAFEPAEGLQRVVPSNWPERLNECDFLVFTCALNEANRHMLNDHTLSLARDGLRVVNVARGPLIDESALIRALHSGKVHSAGLDVFEVEPLPENSPLRGHERCIFGSHNGSNTSDAVERASREAVTHLFQFLGLS
jgi:D-3-phosphoglycerate dehydrogenase